MVEFDVIAFLANPRPVLLDPKSDLPLIGFSHRRTTNAVGHGALI
jgi:hypothetical protein